MQDAMITLTPTADLQSLTERMLSALERIASALEKANAPVVVHATPVEIAASVPEPIIIPQAPVTAEPGRVQLQAVALMNPGRLGKVKRPDKLSKTAWNDEMVAYGAQLWKDGKTLSELHQSLCEKFPDRTTRLTQIAAYAYLKSRGLLTPRASHAGKPRQRQKDLKGPVRVMKDMAQPTPEVSKPAGRDVTDEILEPTPMLNHDLADMLTPTTRRRAQIVIDAQMAGRKTLMSAAEIDEVEKRLLAGKVTRLPSCTTSDGFDVLNKKIVGDRA